MKGIYLDCLEIALEEIYNVIPKVKNLKDPKEYVPRLSGWINRLNEIRQRLKCTSCAAV